MGGHGGQLFLDEVDENLLCSICGAVLDNAVLTPCGHSFCQRCLDTWLGGSATCPQCRALVLPGDPKPILSLRSLVGNLPVRCPNSARGCQHTGRLENLRRHRAACAFGPDGGAASSVNAAPPEDTAPIVAADVADIESATEDEDIDDELSAQSASAEQGSQTDAVIGSSGVGRVGSAGVGRGSHLRAALTRLQWELTVARRDAAAAEARARAMDRELKLYRSDLDQLRRSAAATATAAVAAAGSAPSLPEFDMDYEYGYAPQSISRLAQFIARHLRRRPTFVNADRVFNSVKRCYDNYARGNPSSEYLFEVHMLVATANASDWFTESQRMTFQLWLQSLGRHHKSASSSVGGSGSGGGSYRYYAF